MSDEQQMLARVRAAVAQATAPLAAEIRALTQELRELNGGGSPSWPAPAPAVDVAAPPQLLSANQVAERLCISKSMVYTLMRRGTLRTIRIGRLPRVRESDVAAYIDSHHPPPNPGSLGFRHNP